MIFANSYEEQLSLSLFKPLLMFCKADCVWQWEGLNHSPSSSAGVWMHLTQAEEECQGLTFHNHKIQFPHSLIYIMPNTNQFYLEVGLGA